MSLRTEIRRQLRDFIGLYRLIVPRRRRAGWLQHEIRRQLRDFWPTRHH